MCATSGVRFCVVRVLAYTVSQFTLYAKTAKGTKPDFHRAMNGAESKPFYEAFLEKMRGAYQAERIKSA